MFVKDCMSTNPITITPATPILEALSIYEMNYLLSKMVVKDVMVKNPVTVGPSTTIEEAALMMRENKLGSLLVTEGGKLLGIITQTDVFDQLINIFGLRKAGSRIVVETEDKVGVLADIVDEVRNLGINLLGVAINDKSDQKVQIMIRISTANPQELVEKLKQKGFLVANVI